MLRVIVVRSDRMAGVSGVSIFSIEIVESNAQIGASVSYTQSTNLKRHKEKWEMAKFREPAEEVEVEEVEDQDSPDQAGDSDSDSDAHKSAKAVNAAKKKKKAKTVEVAVEDEDGKPAPVAKKKAKSAKAVGKTNAEPKERKPRKTIFSEDGLAFGDKSLAGRVFNLASREQGVSVKNVRKFLEENKNEKKGGTWVLGRIRKGQRKDGKVAWKVIDDGKISGVLKVGKPKAKMAA